MSKEHNGRLEYTCGGGYRHEMIARLSRGARQQKHCVSAAQSAENTALSLSYNV